jgi:hypothetical protein
MFEIIHFRITIAVVRFFFLNFQGPVGNLFISVDLQGYKGKIKFTQQPLIQIPL